MAERRGARAAAALAVHAVLTQGRSLSDALPAQLAHVAPGERALAQELAFGVLRWQLRLEALLSHLMPRAIKSRDRDLHALLLGGVYQLAYLNVPVHAAVSATVDAAGEMGKEWAKGLVNGVLRNFAREKETLAKAINGDPATALAHPVWLLTRLREAWPEDWRRIAEANNQHPPMTLRVNLLHGTREAYLVDLAGAGIAAHVTPHTKSALVLDAPVPVERLPGFRDGRVSVQDAAAQLAGELMAPVSGEHILDACAAPGGKTAHLLELAPNLVLDALDKDRARLARVSENLQRLGLHARTVAADAGEPDRWWDGQLYDRILLDAPCSATGVIRRHPDIKALRRADDIAALVTEQARLLTRLWPLLKRGGMLLYATCSVLPEENARQITQFLATHADASELPINAAWGRPACPGRQVLPGEDEMDGFYFARIVKA